MREFLRAWGAMRDAAATALRRENAAMRTALEAMKPKQPEEIADGGYS